MSRAAATSVTLLPERTCSMAMERNYEAYVYGVTSSLEDQVAIFTKSVQDLEDISTRYASCSWFLMIRAWANLLEVSPACAL